MQTHNNFKSTPVDKRKLINPCFPYFNLWVDQTQTLNRANIKSTGLSLYHQVVVPPLRKSSRGRGRQLVFFDPEVQITDRAMKEQIGNPLAETQAMVK